VNMKALVLTAPKTLSVQEVPVRQPQEAELLIRVRACGVCGTDLHMFHGDKGAFDNSFPLIMGHEFSGEIVACGEKVTRFQVGDHVAVDPNIYCGQCPACLCGDVHYCENMVGIGTTESGGFAEYCTVPARAAYRVSQDLAFEYAAMVEPLACCLHGVDRSGIRPGDTVAIIGFGSIGQMIFQLVRCAGAARIIVIEPIAEKRRIAEAMGAYQVIDPHAAQVEQELLQAGVQINSVIECVGLKATMEMAVEIAGNRATVMLFGLTPPETKLEILAFEQIFKKELTLTGSYINPLVSQRVVDLLSYGRLDMSKIITDRIALSDAVKVFTDDSYRNSGKIVIGDF